MSSTGMVMTKETAEKTARSIFVGNIPYEATEEKLIDLFNKAGPVIGFRLVYDRESGKPKGYGFCEYNSAAIAASALRNLQNIEFNGRPLRIGPAAGEQNSAELALSNPAVGPPVESPFGDPVDPSTAPEAISRAVASLPPEQMYELMKQMKLCIQNNPNEARNMLLQNPQLAYALLQAQIVMKIIDPKVAIAMLNRSHDQIPPIMPDEQSDAQTQQQPAVIPKQAPPPIPQQQPPTSFAAPVSQPSSSSGGGFMNPTVGFQQPPQMHHLGHPPGSNIPPPISSYPMDQQLMPPPPIQAMQNMYPPPGGSNASQMPPHHHQPPMPGMMPPPAGPFDFPGNRPPPPNPGMMMRPPHQPNMPPPVGFAQQAPVQHMTSEQQQQPAAMSNSQAASVAAMAAAGGANLLSAATSSQGGEQEKINLIMQVLQLSDDQLALLPDDQRRSILILKDQLGKTGAI